MSAIAAGGRLVDAASLINDLEGLYAGEDTDSGIRDPVLKERVRTFLHALADKDRSDAQLFSFAFSEFMATLLLHQSLGPEARAKGYGFEDLLAFLEWFKRDMFPEMF